MEFYKYLGAYLFNMFKIRCLCLYWLVLNFQKLNGNNYGNSNMWTFVPSLGQFVRVSNRENSPWLCLGEKTDESGSSINLGIETS